MASSAGGSGLSGGVDSLEEELDMGVSGGVTYFSGVDCDVGTLTLVDLCGGGE